MCLAALVVDHLVYESTSGFFTLRALKSQPKSGLHNIRPADLESFLNCKKCCKVWLRIIINKTKSNLAVSILGICLFYPSAVITSCMYIIFRSCKPQTTSQERCPTGIRPGTPSPQRIHFWPANHCIQKVCIHWRSGNHVCWWRLADSGRGAEQGHSKCKWILPDLEAKAQNYKHGVGSILPQQQGKQTWAKCQPQQRNPTFLLRA